MVSVCSRRPHRHTITTVIATRAVRTPGLGGTGERCLPGGARASRDDPEQVERCELGGSSRAGPEQRSMMCSTGTARTGLEPDRNNRIEQNRTGLEPDSNRENRIGQDRTGLEPDWNRENRIEQNRIGLEPDWNLENRIEQNRIGLEPDRNLENRIEQNRTGLEHGERCSSGAAPSIESSGCQRGKIQHVVNSLLCSK